MLRSAVPIWLPFLIALGLELNYFVGALRPAPARRSDRGPPGRRSNGFGYDDAEELLLVREAGEELWIPYSGETEEELEALVDQARKGPDDEDITPPTAETDPEREGVRLPFRRLAAGLGLIAALALVFWFVESHTGWNGLDESTRRGGRPLLPGGRTDRGEAGDDPM